MGMKGTTEEENRGYHGTRNEEVPQPQNRNIQLGDHLVVYKGLAGNEGHREIGGLGMARVEASGGEGTAHSTFSAYTLSLLIRT